MLHHEVEEGTDSEENRRMPVGSVREALQRWERPVLGQRQGVDVPETAEVQIAGVSVMIRVGLPPVLIGNQGEDPDAKAHHVPGPPRLEERPVATVMLDHE